MLAKDIRPLFARVPPKYSAGRQQRCWPRCWVKGEPSPQLSSKARAVFLALQSRVGHTSGWVQAVWAKQDR